MVEDKEIPLGEFYVGKIIDALTPILQEIMEDLDSQGLVAVPVNDEGMIEEIEHYLGENI